MDFVAPSGRVFGKQDQAIWLSHHAAKSIEWSDPPKYVWHDGNLSHLYAKLRGEIPAELWTLIGAKISWIAYNFMMSQSDLRQPCFMGVPDAGIPFACAAMLAHPLQGARMPPRAAFRLIHKQQKMHGADAGKWIDEHPNGKCQRYFLIEQTASRGKSIEEAIEHYLEDGYALDDLVCILYFDWQLGAEERLRKKYRNRKIVIRSLYNGVDVLAFFMDQGLWPEERKLLINRERLELGATCML